MPNSILGTGSWWHHGSLTWRCGWRQRGRLQAAGGRAGTRGRRCPPCPDRRGPGSCSGEASQPAWSDAHPLRGKIAEERAWCQITWGVPLAVCLCVCVCICMNVCVFVCACACMGVFVYWERVWEYVKTHKDSPSSMSREKRVRTRPRGVVSKKRMGLRRSWRNSLSWRTEAALTVHWQAETQGVWMRRQTNKRNKTITTLENRIDQRVLLEKREH